VTAEAPSGPQIIESGEVLRHLARDRALRGHTYRNLSLPGLRIERGDFANATFERVTMQDAELDRADLSRVTFRQSDLRRGHLPGVLLARSTLTDCDLTEVVLVDGILEHNDWHRVQLANVDLTGAKLVACRFLGCNTYGMKAPHAVLIRCTFHDPAPNAAAELTRANFSNATLIECQLSGANLIRANFSNALVVRCNFAGAILTGAQVEGAKFVGCNFTGTDLPDGLRGTLAGC